MSVRERAEKVGQGHLFKYCDQLSEEQQKTLTEDVANLPLEDLGRIFKGIGM
jgi:hypothetical protein